MPFNPLRGSGNAASILAGLKQQSNDAALQKSRMEQHKQQRLADAILGGFHRAQQRADQMKSQDRYYNFREGEQAEASKRHQDRMAAAEKQNKTQSALAALGMLNRNQDRFDTNRFRQQQQLMSQQAQFQDTDPMYHTLADQLGKLGNQSFAPDPRLEQLVSGLLAGPTSDSLEQEGFNRYFEAQQQNASELPYAAPSEQLVNPFAMGQLPAQQQPQPSLRLGNYNRGTEDPNARLQQYAQSMQQQQPTAEQRAQQQMEKAKADYYKLLLRQFQMAGADDEAGQNSLNQLIRLQPEIQEKIGTSEFGKLMGAVNNFGKVEEVKSRMDEIEKLLGARAGDYTGTKAFMSGLLNFLDPREAFGFEKKPSKYTDEGQQELMLELERLHQQLNQLQSR